MPDKEPTNLPILDDIIVPGDANKAVVDTASKVQNTFREVNDSEIGDLSRADSKTDSRIAFHTTENNEVIFTDTKDVRPAQHDTRAERDKSAVTKRRAGTAPVIATEDAAPAMPADTTNDVVVPRVDIDTLAEQILQNMMPALQHLIREKIRQTLQQHLSGEIDHD